MCQAYDLQDPEAVAAYLQHADIRLIRAEYLYELVKQKRTLPRRQEVEEWALVRGAEVREWAVGSRDAMICAVSHPWETREHPDPTGSQVKCLAGVASVYDAAYFSDIWFFLDYVSLFQYKRTPQQDESFRRAMENMHVLFCHECTWTFRLEGLTPDAVWQNSSEHQVRVYDAKSGIVRAHPLSGLISNRLPYRSRGWCVAVAEWSSLRSKTEQNQRIDSPLPGSSENQLHGKAPTAPAVFAMTATKLMCTHRSDLEAVIQLQREIFYEKVEVCKEALLTNLPEGELGQLAKVLPHYRRLKVLRLRNLAVGRSEAEDFGKALASNDTVEELEIKSAQDRSGHLVKAVREVLSRNSTITKVRFTYSEIDDEGAKAFADVLKTNSTVTNIDLRGNAIGDEGTKALANMLQINNTITNIGIEGNPIGVEGDEAIARVLSTRLTSLAIDGGSEAPTAAADAWTGRVRIQGLAEQLKNNSSTAHVSLKMCGIDDEGAKALARMLQFNITVSNIDLRGNAIGDEGAKALAEGIMHNVAITNFRLGHNEIGTDGAKAIAEALMVNTTVTNIDLKGNPIGPKGREAVAEVVQRSVTPLVVDGDSMEEFKMHFDDWQRSGFAPLPVVQLCFVGQGRAGKTTTLRRLSGEPVQEGKEVSTHGVELWSGQAQRDLSSAWQTCGKSSFDASAVDAMRKRKRHEERQLEQARGQKQKASIEARPGHQQVERRDTSPSAEDTAASADLPKEQDAPLQADETEPNESLRRDRTNEAAQQKEEESLGPRLMDNELFLEMSNADFKDEPSRPRLQCWDFPGQADYAQCNLLYFHGRGIYLVFVDVSLPLEEAWHELRFWLWAVAQYAFDNGKTANDTDSAPPVVLVGTKWCNKQLDEQYLDWRVETFREYVPRLKSQLQMGPGPSSSCHSKWVFPIENFADNVESYISPLRERLNELAAELLLPAKHDTVNRKPHAGLQSRTYHASWCRAHDLLTGLGDGMDLAVPWTQLPSAVKGPNHCFNLKSDQSMKTRNGEKILVPEGALVQVLGSAESGKDLLVKVSCTSLALSQVKRILAGLKPRPIVGEEVFKVLSLLHSLGTLFWFPEEGLRENVLLAVQRVAVALTRIISVRFWAEKRLEHSEAYKKELLACLSKQTAGIRRLNTEGLVNRKFLQELWAQDFGQGKGEDRRKEDGMSNILLQIMEQKGLILKRAFKDDFIVPCCLPAAIVPESAREACKVRYLSLGGLVTPTILSQTADRICKSERGSQKLSPGPPQLFRNHVELSSDTALISLSLSPADGFQLLRIRVTSPSSATLSEEDAEAEVNRITDLFLDCLGIEQRTRSKLVTSSETTPVDPELLLAGRLMSDVGFLKQRFLPNLSLDLASVVRRVCVLSDVRPAGSFRFCAMHYPCDVDMEEYVVSVEKDRNAALSCLARWLKRVVERCEQEANIYWGGLKAGKCPAKSGKVLTWSTDELLKGKKVCAVGSRQETILFDKALEHGNKSRTAFITVFAKVSLFSDQPSASRFFEVTNVIRFGHVSNGQVIPVTEEYDFLEVLDACSYSYSGATPKAMKFVKRLWERAAYLAQRNMAVSDSLVMLKALQPIFGHWVAELAQIAAHAETLHAMLEKGFKEPVLSDLKVFGDSLECMRNQMQGIKADTPESDSERSWEPAAAAEVLETLEHLMGCLSQGSADGGQLERKLKEGQDLLEGCVEFALNQWLGSFRTQLTRSLHEHWEFPSGHLPIGAEVESIRVCSWHLQSLSSSRISSRSHEGHQQSIVGLIIAMLRDSKSRKHVLCLQGCWQELLEQVRHEFTQMWESFGVLRTGSDAEPDNQQAIIYDKEHLVEKSFSPDFRAKAVTVAQFLLKKGARQLRIITAHLPAEPFRHACRELCECVRRLHDDAQIPTLLLGDFSVQEQAIGALLKHHAKVPIKFAPVPYPTAIFEGSLLPKRTDAIAVLSEDLKATPLEAFQVVAGLETHAELLKSRCLGLADWDTDGSFADIAAASETGQSARPDRQLHLSMPAGRPLQALQGARSTVRGAEAPSTEQKDTVPQEHVDPASGNLFYYSRTTGESRWDKPAPEASSSVGSLPAEEPSSLRVLPTDWDEHVDPSTGHVFYHNTTTGESTWEKPTAEASGSVGSLPAEEPSSFRVLSPDWDEHVDPSTGNVFYYNKTTGESRWDRPLSPDWDEHVDPDTGNLFYHNRTTGESRWDKP
ncbi:NLRC3 [Symbiodinium sp. CCMP2592]|nr:NLRC3 [Symbiodinium sp. CCMP2592]